LRSSLIEALNQDYVRTAHAKGARPRVVLVKHAMRNAILGYLTVLGLQMASLLAGSVVTEQVFAWQGIGLLAVQAINSRDMAIVQAIVIVSSRVVMLANLGVDVLYAVIDPRIQYSLGSSAAASRRPRRLAPWGWRLRCSCRAPRPGSDPTPARRRTSWTAYSHLPSWAATPGTSWAPTTWAVTCSAASCTAAGWRSPSGSRACCSRPPSASRSAWCRATSAERSTP